MMIMMNGSDYKAVITSDLHMSALADPSDAIVSLMKLQRPVFDAFFDTLIKEHTDLLILCGDNTQSGSQADMRMLAKYLNTLEKNGIRIIMTTGNHDFDCGQEELYEQLFFPLLKPDEKDPHSLSYLKRIGSCTFFAMDDHEGRRSPSGSLKDATMKWLERKLREEQKSGQKIIFLSHHSLHADAWMGRPDFYCLRPAGVKELLVRYGVKLACSGHLHDPKIYQSSLCEIVTPMLLSGAHMYGEMHLGETSLHYQLKPFAFDGLLAKQVYEKDQSAYENRKAVFEKILKDSLNEYELQPCLNSLMRWFNAQQSGMVYERRNEFLHDEDLVRALDVLEKTAWGRWIRSSLDPSCVSSCELLIRY